MENISVILPIYNESECLDNIFDSVLEFSRNNPYYRFIFVNDGSIDNTQEILEKKIRDAKNINISVVSYRFNRGKGYAIKKGLESSQEDYICFLDGDLAYSLAHLEILVDYLERFDIVIGSRNLIPHNLKQIKLTRRVAGKVFNLITRKLLSLGFSDMQAGIKGFRKDVAVDLFSRQSINSFAFDVELLYLAQKKGYTIGEMPVIVSETHLYKSSKVNLVIDSLKMLMNLIQIKYNDMSRLYE